MHFYIFAFLVFLVFFAFKYFLRSKKPLIIYLILELPTAAEQQQRKTLI